MCIGNGVELPPLFCRQSQQPLDEPSALGEAVELADSLEARLKRHQEVLKRNEQVTICTLSTTLAIFSFVSLCIGPER